MKTLSFRISLAVLLPILGLCGFVGHGVVTRLAVAEHSASVQRLSFLAVKAGALVHELQKERGRTAAYVGSRGATFAPELRAQRTVTDEKFVELRSFLKDFDADRSGSSVQAALSAAMKRLEELSETRRAASDLTISGPHAVKWYTETIAATLDVSGQLYRLKGDAQISARAAAYVNFMQAKERAGIERATLTASFSTDALAPGAFVKFASVVAAQKVYMDVFTSFATQEQQQLASQTITGEAVNEVSRIRQVVFDRAGEGQFGISPDHWFQVSTRRIDLMKKVEDTLADDLTAVAVNLESAARREVNIFLLVAGAILAMAGGSSWLIIRSVTRPLTEVVSELTSASAQVTRSAGHISEVSQSLAHGASEQAASLQTTSASSEELSSMTARNAEHSKESVELMQIVDECVSRTNTTLSQMMISMNDITESSGRISRIIRVIDEIAFQTNILALNAAVEAARAGEAGMGFAVVANEVRTLAHRSAEAAKETAEMIEESISKSNCGSARLAEVAAATQSITESAGKAKVLIAEVSSGSREEAQGIQQIANSIMEMEQVTQRTASVSEESAAAGEELRAQAEAMRAIVHRLTALVGCS